MKIEVIEVIAEDLRIGDEWHMDEYAITDSKRIVRAHDGRIWKVINEPFFSENKQLFWDKFAPTCMVVPVSYMDGARGSRLFDPDEKILIRRDLAEKPA